MNDKNDKIKQILSYIHKKNTHSLLTKKLKQDKQIITLLIKELGHLQENRCTWNLDTGKLLIKAIETTPTTFNRIKANEDFPILKTDEYKKTGKPYTKIEYDQKLSIDNLDVDLDE